MPRCARCEERFNGGDEWIELRHHHTYMNFESAFCGTECAVAYLRNGLESDQLTND